MSDAKPVYEQRENKAVAVLLAVILGVATVAAVVFGIPLAIHEKTASIWLALVAITFVLGTSAFSHYSRSKAKSSLVLRIDDRGLQGSAVSDDPDTIVPWAYVERCHNVMGTSDYKIRLRNGKDIEVSGYLMPPFFNLTSYVDQRRNAVQESTITTAS